MKALARLRCWWRNHHDPQRVLPDGFRCRDCGKAGADLADLGFRGSAYVPTVRRVYDRLDGFTRTSAWERGPRGW